MANQKWTLDSNATSGNRLANVGNAALHLSTGDLVMLLNSPDVTDPNKMTLQLVPGTAHTTPAVIATIDWKAAATNTFTGNVTICRDASDNIYVIGQSGTQPNNADLVIQMYKKGAGLTWSLRATSNINAFPTGGFSAVWANTGTGTNGAGWLVIIGQESGSPRIYTADAGGIALGQSAPGQGTGTLAVWASFLTGTAATHAACLDIVANGFGGTSGILVYESAANTINITQWSIASSGQPSTSSLGTDATGTLSAATKFGCYYIANNVFASAYPSSSNAGQISVIGSGLTGSLSSPVDSGTASNFPAPAASLSWDATTYASSLYIYGWSSGAATTMLRVPYTFTAASPPVPTLGAVITDDTVLGTTNTTVRAVNQPVDNTHVDYQWYQTTSPLSLMGDFSNLPAAPNAPVLGLPVNNDVEYLAGGYTFTWTFSGVSLGDAQTAYAFKRQAAGGAVQWWTGSAWQSSEIFVSTATTQIAFAAYNWSVGTTYTWSVATKGVAGSAGPYSNWQTIYSAQTLPSTPTISAALDPTNNRVTLTIAGTSTDVAEVQVSRDAGVTWADLRNYSALTLAAGAGTAYDYEAVTGSVATYRVRQTNTSQAPYDAPSAWSTSATATPAALSTFWLRNPADGSIGMAVNVREGSWSTQITENSTIHYPLGATFPVVLADTLKGEDGSATFYTITGATETALLALMSQQNTLLLFSSDNRMWYIRITSPRARGIPAGVGPSAYKEWQISWVQVATP